MRIPTLLILLLLSVGTFAADSMVECKALHDEEWCEDNERLHAERVALDTQLNAVYRKVMAKLQPHQQKALRESQRAWLQYHLLECGARQNLLDGGNSLLRANVLNGCINDFLRSRTQELSSEYCPVVGGCK